MSFFFFLASLSRLIWFNISYVRKSKVVSQQFYYPYIAGESAIVHMAGESATLIAGESAILHCGITTGPAALFDFVFLF